MPPALFQRDVTIRAGNTIVADPTNSQVAYIATYGGGDDIFRYDPSGAGSWKVIDNSGAQGGTAPHADARDLAFIGNNVLVESNDGGIYFIKNPLDSANNAWHSFSGGGGTGRHSAMLCGRSAPRTARPASMPASSPCGNPGGRRPANGTQASSSMRSKALGGGAPVIA